MHFLSILDTPCITFQLLNEGHRVTILALKDFEKTKELYKDVKNVKVINSVSDIPSDIDFAIFVGATNREFIVSSQLRKRFPGLLAPIELAQLELDRELGKRVAMSLGLNVPKFTQMRISEAISYVKQRNKPQVIKAIKNKPTFSTTICNTVDDTIFSLIKLQKILGDIEVEVEDKIFGTEIGVESFFNGKTFMKPINISFEHKYPYDGDMGPLSPEAGTLMYYEFPSLLYMETLYKIEPLLARFGYRGDFAMGMMLEHETNKLYFLEFTVRFGYPEIMIQLSAMKNMALSELFLTIYNGTSDTLDIEDKFINGVCYQTGGAPIPAGMKVGEGHLINYKNKGLTIKDLYNPPENVYFVDIERIDDYIAAAAAPMPLVATGSGYTAAEAVLNSYLNIQNFSIVYGFYRTDIGRKMIEEGCKHIYDAGYMDYQRFSRFYLPQFDIRSLLKSFVI